MPIPQPALIPGSDPESAAGTPGLLRPYSPPAAPSGANFPRPLPRYALMDAPSAAVDKLRSQGYGTPAPASQPPQMVGGRPFGGQQDIGDSRGHVYQTRLTTGDPIQLSGPMAGNTALGDMLERTKMNQQVAAAQRYDKNRYRPVGLPQ